MNATTQLEAMAPPRGWRWSNLQMVCPNPHCGYRGPAAKQPRGSRVALWLLMSLAILPGLIYAIFFSGERYCCPQCRTVVDLG